MSAKNLIAVLRVAAVEAQKEAEEAINAFGEKDAALFIEQARDAQETLDAAIAEAVEEQGEKESEKQVQSFVDENELSTTIAARIQTKPVQDKGRKAKRQAKFAPVAKQAPVVVDPIERLDEVGRMLEMRSRRNQAALKAQLLAGPTPVEIMKAKRLAEIQPVVLPKEPTLASELEHEPVTREGIELRAFNARRTEQAAKDAQRRLERQGKQALRQMDAPVSFSTETGEKEAPRFENPFERRAREAEEAKKAKEIKAQQARVNAVKSVDAKWAAL